MRRANEIDFWRGLALVAIFVNHIPGSVYERFTPRNFGLSDSAELFVFLAGWALRFVADASAAERVGLVRLILRLGARAVTLYAAQILITTVAIALIAACAMLLDNPLLLEWHNAAAVFQNPVPTHIGIVTLTHQLGYFDILPLYVVLMLGAPVMAVVHRVRPAALLPLSGLLYAVTLASGINLPTWPVDGVWFFNPLAWQLVFVTGFVLAGRSASGAFVRRNTGWLRALGAVGVVLGAYLAQTDYSPDPLRVPSPPLFFMFDKTFLSPARFVHFLAVAITFAGTFRYVVRFAAPVSRFLSMLGRNSLNVFCVASLLSLCGQMARFGFGGFVAVDTAVLLCGVAALGVTAWMSELRDRLRASRPGSGQG
jgi:hypothetical protein